MIADYLAVLAPTEPGSAYETVADVVNNWCITTLWPKKECPWNTPEAAVKGLLQIPEPIDDICFQQAMYTGDMLFWGYQAFVTQGDTELKALDFSPNEVGKIICTLSNRKTL